MRLSVQHPLPLLLVLTTLAAAACSHTEVAAPDPFLTGAPASGLNAMPSDNPNHVFAWMVPGVDPIDRARQADLQVKTYDMNRDGKSDIFTFFRRSPDAQSSGKLVEVILRKEVDLNQDGRIDVVHVYDASGHLIEELDDLDFDGKADEISYFKEGTLQRKELYFKFDGKPDLTKYYAAGHLVRTEADRNHSGHIDTWEYYENDALQRVGTDTNGDGKVDQWERRDDTSSPAPSSAPASSPNAAGAGAQPAATPPPPTAPVAPAKGKVPLKGKSSKASKVKAGK